MLWDPEQVDRWDVIRILAEATGRTFVLIEETPLDDGAPMLWRDFGQGRWRMAFDPKQLPRTTALGLLRALKGDFVEVSA